MPESTDPVTPQPQTEEMHWAVSSLREDLQDIRNEIRGLHTRIDDASAAATVETRSLHARIDDASAAATVEARSLHARIDEVRTAVSDEIRDEIRGVYTRINEASTATNARLDSHLRWTMTAMVGMTGLLAAIIKL
jgi:predicted  nucleic acid-binding Zn-ribbon protein